MSPLDDLATLVNSSPEVVLVWIRDIAVVVVGWLLARRVEQSAMALLSSVHYEAVRRPPWVATNSASPGASDSDIHEPLTRSAAIGGGAIVWLGVAWALANLHGSITFVLLAKVALEVLVLLLMVGTVGIGFCHVLSDAVLRLLVKSPARRALDRLAPADAESAEPLSLAIARLCGVTIYLVSIVTLLLGGAEALGWMPTGNVLASAWLLLLHFSGALAILLIGWLGVGWLDATHADLSRPGGRLKVGIVLASLLFAAISLPGVATIVAAVIPLGFGAVVLGGVGVAAVALGWPIRSRLKDVWAGVLLRLEPRRKISIPPTGAAQIEAVEIVSTRLRFKGRPVLLRNQEVLDLIHRAPESVDGLPPELQAIIKMQPEDLPAVPASADEKSDDVIETVG
jgi:hypothetical protein